MDALVLPFNKINEYNEHPDVYLNDYVHGKAFGNYSYHLDPKNVARDENGDLLLWTRPPVGGVVPSSQLSTRRSDFLLGTYRSLISFPRLPGSCAGFFYYYNDSQEIDIEYLGQKSDMLYVSSKTIPLPDYKASTWENVPVSKGSLEDKFINYRFDWLPDRVDFYMDDKRVSTLPASPSMPGKVMLMHWSSGDENWSGTPHADIVSKFRNVAAFFNSTSPTIKRNYDTLCQAHRQESTALCKVANFSTTDLYGYNENVIRLSASSTDETSSAVRTSPSIDATWVSLVACIVVVVMYVS
ncbi:uncharacterized protein SPPG_07971 [Spizellomyces punctatus DAOM BR117]|uniref:GH16 domain-containing protein n=1 Tax=Spizellomyces punctatus (strain DAOM BR117) TaxID=645134 RepID=A0A0L0H725_SPIPD|nr:uncharacterized protein SPPG_07971 [Spizellomyces punctatus DAOM BR117]KNC96764.1 hypothetical protein SPPG_07971 [Spizellomyces punctatus DAOM BR117]|eukprot:XP_016604804.1 hypothetical protein SPPG_07971 [Spizellomyces punctatus DAOM BR117]